MVLYGTRVFTKFEGYFGERKECEVCHRTYRSAFVRNKVWAHLNYIPLFPVSNSSLIDFQRILVISSPSISTSGVVIFILAIASSPYVLINQIHYKIF